MKKLLIAAALSAALIAAPAVAQTSQATQMAPVPSFYVGGGVGAARTDSNETSWKAYAGYQFSPTWGIEAAYNDLGRYRGSDIENWTLAGTGTVALGQGWSLLGKVGAAANRSHFAGENRHTDLLLGVGVGYSMSRNLGLRLEYEDFGKMSDANNGNNSRGSNLALSVKYAF